MRTIVDKPGTLFLGKQGEHLARELAFREPALWAEEFGTGAAQLLCQPPGCGGKPYPVLLEQEDGFSVWHVTGADTARAGYGRCELRWSVEDHVVKSKTYVTYVADGISHCGGGDPWGRYLEQIAKAGAQALEAASRAESAALHPPTIRDGTWWIWNPNKDGYTDTGVAASGGGDGTADHRALLNRDAADQHPIASITGLTEAVDRIPAPAEPITNIELEEILS